MREGISEGDEIVVSAQFLIDSESNLTQAIRALTRESEARESEARESEAPEPEAPEPEAPEPEAPTHDLSHQHH